MLSFNHEKLGTCIHWAARSLYTHGQPITTGSWHAQKNEQPMVELLNLSFSSSIPFSRTVLEQEVKPNLPWAYNHFEERVSGQPLNPPPSAADWPYAQAGHKSHTYGNGKFSHTYPERIWPKKAHAKSRAHHVDPLTGIRFEYGDLNDLVNLLKRDPYTRQAYLPIWFPEDTGSVKSQRVPCTLGYHFIFRGEWIHCNYYIRSCDIIRHFRDDVYLACLLCRWVCDCLELEPVFAGVTPGYLTMHITSLHCFQAERQLLVQKF